MLGEGAGYPRSFKFNEECPRNYCPIGICDRSSEARLALVSKVVSEEILGNF